MDHIEELMYKMSCGRFSRAKVKAAPMINSITKAINIFPKYSRPSGDSEVFSGESESPIPCNGNTKQCVSLARLL